MSGFDNRKGGYNNNSGDRGGGSGGRGGYRDNRGDFRGERNERGNERGNDRYERGNDRGNDRDHRDNRYGDNRDNRYGGGSGGGRGGGRGGGGRSFGGRGGGKNKSMAEVPRIQSSVTGQGMTDRDLMPILCPTLRDRSELVKNPRLPSHEEWRTSNPIGYNLQPGVNTVRANYFRVNPRNVATRFFQYHVHIKQYDRSGILKAEDTSLTDDYRTNVALLGVLQERHPEWKLINGIKVGLTYDSRSTIFTSYQLPFTEVNSDGQPFFTEDVAIPNSDGTDSRKRYKVSITFTTSFASPARTEEEWCLNQDNTLIRALDSSLLAFARKQLASDNPLWYIVGNVGYSSTGETLQLQPAFVAMRGFFVGIKTCLAGLVLVSDMSVSVFLNGGPIINVISDLCKYHSTQSFIENFTRDSNPSMIHHVDITLKKVKIKLIHLGHSKRFKSLGPPANSPESSFETDENRRITVADYYAHMGRTSPVYKNFLHNGRLRYPSLPTINVGTSSKPILIPMELVVIDRGQNFSHKCNGEMTSQIIRYAAVVPDERFKALIGTMDSVDSLISTIKSDPVVEAFGLSEIELEPIAVASRLLPPPKLRYSNQEFQPGLAGSWNIMQGKPVKFVRNPPAPARDGTYMYGVLIVGRLPSDWQRNVEDFQREIEADADKCGLKLKRGGNPLVSTDNIREIGEKLNLMMAHGARIVLVVLCGDHYSNVKYAADPMGLTTQCLKWKNIQHPPKGYVMSVLLKINTKMGGTNHTLSSRLPDRSSSTTSVFQDPPASLCWVFDKPCMLVGIDVSHAEPGSDRRSVAAVVGSLNGQASQYAAHISAQAPRVEIVAALEDAMISLFTTFRQRNNGAMPQHVVVYRDGVGDGQFNEILDRELPCIQNALASLGTYTTKISIVICQKRHNTRLVYEESPNNFINACPGLCVDASGGSDSIASATFNEFYLNSHAAIQGTAKACKYSLLYDEIGFKISELELLTYWSCYLYARCNKSVSLATPAYYAHWASKRAKFLFSAGASDQELINISNTWSQPSRYSTMFFI